MRRDLKALAAIFVGGALGALARVEVSTAWPAAGGHWPWATFAVNIAGASFLGFAWTWLSRRRPAAEVARSFVGTGFCGGLTTFSTMQLELLKMLDAGRVGWAVLYAGVSIAAGLAGLWLAAGLAR